MIRDPLSSSSGGIVLLSPVWFYTPCTESGTVELLKYHKVSL